MHWDDVGTQVCSIARAMSVLGDRWTMLIIREAFAGTTAFDDIVAYTGATPQVVSDRLKRLTEAGVIRKQSREGHRGRAEYILTPMGEELHPVLCTIMVWGDKWLSNGRGRPNLLRHTQCDCETSPRLACDSCGEIVTRDTLKSEPSLAMKRYRATMLRQAGA